MLRPRIIPCLLLRDKGLVKTVKFGSDKYVGDPMNAVRIFNEKQADELMVLDIDATSRKRPPDLNTIANLAAECRMPLCYGGGVTSASQVGEIVRLGVEKVAISTAAIVDPEIVTRASETVGSQSVVVVLDVKKSRFRGRHEVWTNNATRNTHKLAIEVAAQMQVRGAGEIVINSVDNDGVMDGYDFALADEVRRVVDVPLTVLGGAGSYQDLELLVKRYGTVGAAAGSLFVFKGIHRAVLINYPNRHCKDSIVAEAGVRD